MARCAFWIMFAALLSVSLARYEDCENPPAVEHASMQIQDDEDTVRVIYTCNSGYELHGSAELICDLDSDLWDSNPPVCVPAGDDDPDEASNEIEQRSERQRKKRPVDIPEDRAVSSQMAATLDMSCVQAKVKAPEIRHGFVQKYDRRRKADKIFLVALYACNNNYELEDADISALYCSAQKWVGELPSCVALGEYTEEDEEEGEEYDEYEAVDEEDDDDVDDERAHNRVAPPPPPPPTQPVSPPAADNELSNEIIPEPTQPVGADVHVEVESEDHTAAAATETTLVVEPTQDPYTPRVLDENCGPDHGGCDQKCERLLFPGENEPRLKCSCFDGFSLDPYDYSSCHDIDECQLNNGGCEQICHNLPGSFQCACEQGLQIDTLNGKTCIDINECLLRNGHGPCQDTCYNLHPGYRCTCEQLPGTRLSADQHACEDAGECAKNNGGCSHVCVPSLGRVYCRCPTGFVMSDDNKNCTDINECESPEVVSQCAGGCENTHGSYRCIPALNTREDAVTGEDDDNDETDNEDADPTIVRVSETLQCPSGFRAAADGSRCVDVDECAEGTSGCDECINTEGSFECTCPGGYDLTDDERTCIDINECEIVIEDESGVAPPYKLCSQVCVNTPGSYVCSCEGNQHLLADSRSCAPDTCQDLDNPQLNKTRCAHQCVDLPSGVYECICPAGYKLSDDLHNCEAAENICLTSNAHERCAPGTCLPSEDNTSFSCLCPEGYADEVYSCREVDECAAGTHSCSHECINTAGSYRCACPNGYHFAEGSDQQCVDEDECQASDNVCGELNCVNLPGSFRCLCADGKEPNVQTGICDAVDICADNNNGCEQICKSEEGGNCACYDGFALTADGKLCQDVDECQVNNGGCHQLCRNEPGGYSCACQTGFEFLDLELPDYCFDIDECSLGVHSCGPGLTCENLNGSYTCLCPPGYALSVQSTAPPMISPASASLRSLHSSAFLPISHYSYAFASPIPLTSHASATYATNMQSCLDIDECSINNGNCSHFCLNFPGSFQCACPPGYSLNSLDNRTCILVDACLQQNGGCSHTCTYAASTVVCSCPTGHALAGDGKTCQDVDECAHNNGGCAQQCVNTVGSFKCACVAGYELAAGGRDCLDVDECANGYGNCTFICVNLLGSYACACEAGFELAADRRTCIDIDECSLQRHDCSHECVNTNGGYDCLCPSGYLLEANKATCKDVDECAGETHGCSHTCKNQLGTYECTCPTDQMLDMDGRTCRPINPCPSGSVLNSDGTQCVLDDECERNNGGCSHLCTSQLGCSCPPGLTLSSDGKTCEDIDECSVNNGDCSHDCRNTYGAYECVCPSGLTLLDGKRCGTAHVQTRLGPGGSCPPGFTVNTLVPGECEDIDECTISPRVCQYQCVNSVGSYQCVCPTGYRLRNGRECEDINECEHNNGGCVGGECINQNGSFECKCSVGSRLAADRRTCERRTELRDQCPPFEAPQNGEIHCTKYRHKKKHFYSTKCKVWCNQGYQLQGPTQRFCNSSGLWDNFENRCSPIVCSAIAPPSNGIVLPDSCTHGKTFIGERCRLQCNPGFVPVGKTTTVCTSSQQWSNDGSFACVQAQLLSPVGETTRPVAPTSTDIFFKPPVSRPPQTPQTQQRRPLYNLGNTGIERPYIKCPRNSTIFLPSNEATAHVVLQKPLTNLDFRYVEAYPSWAKNLQAHLPVGTYVIVFRGQEPGSGRRARCQTIINIRRAEPPKINYCTPSFEVSLGAGQAYRSVVWEEPRFETSTGGLKKLYKSRLPGELFGVGLHTVYYEGTNEEGLTSRCQFKIHVKPAAAQPPLSQSSSLNLHVPSAPTYQMSNLGRVSNFASPVMHPTLTSAPLLAGHESYIVCPGRSPVKITQAQSINLPAGCFVKNVRMNSLRQYAQRYFVSPRWTPFSSF